MKTNAEINKSKKISERIDTVKDAIRAHRKNIKKLKYIASMQNPKNSGLFAPRQKYSSLPYSEKTIWTINLETKFEN